MRIHLPDGAYIAPSTARLPGEDWETFVARDWKHKAAAEGHTGRHPTAKIASNIEAQDRLAEIMNQIVRLMRDGEERGIVQIRAFCGATDHETRAAIIALKNCGTIVASSGNRIGAHTRYAHAHYRQIRAGKGRFYDDGGKR